MSKGGGGLIINTALSVTNQRVGATLTTAVQQGACRRNLQQARKGCTIGHRQRQRNRCARQDSGRMP
jgi:hypothetical protein